MDQEATADRQPYAEMPDPVQPVADYLSGCPAAVRKGLMDLRALGYQVAGEDARIGPLHETLKWGEPSYLTDVTRSGTTLRLAAKKTMPDTYGLFFNCRTSIAERVTDLYPNTFVFDGKRGLLFSAGRELPVEEVKACISLVLTYRLGGLF
ncbi:DUF1801 domain-containing protein [Roseibium aggregatum]|uniref:DUF1801 domain-containing protein n=1 Tax=Roseibium aggregatum TaxID=187304 RepID=A0A926NVC7_9HYPH|nr:DUF1801 domain-containing protein [Roseibium aggregatum]MBD1544800.1 DUF1801 domain-containing protein [Roseibium aggregatum]